MADTASEAKRMAAAVPGVEQPLPAVHTDVAPDEYDADSAYDSEVASYTTSLASSAVDYKYTNGRRYHAYKEGAYIYPNDEIESERLDVAHKMIEVAMGGKLHFAPVKNPGRVLDIGTGTGIWSIEFGEANPDSQILGNDLSPIQPRWVPPNVHFEVDDVEAPWTFSSKFDYIFCRTMGNVIKDWPGLVQNTFDTGNMLTWISNLRPGAYAEFIDFDITYISPDNSLKEGSDISKLNSVFITETRKLGMEPCPGVYLEKWMKKAGFEEVLPSKRFLPLGTWPADKHLKEVGAWNFMMVDEFLEGFLNYLYAQHLGMSKEEISVACAKIRKQLRDPKCHCMYTLWIVYGRKPLDGNADEEEEDKAKVVEPTPEKETETKEKSSTEPAT